MHWPCGSALLLALATVPAGAQTIDDLRTMSVYVGDCIAGRISTGATGITRDATLTYSVRRDGTLISEPRISYSQPKATEPQQAIFIAAARRALAECTPLPLTPALGNAIAGRRFSQRIRQTPPTTRS
jgi:hypothetical protein